MDGRCQIFHGPPVIRPLVHNRQMSEDSAEGTARANEAQQAYREAVERERRVQIWLEGMLSGGPPLADATKQWRQALGMYEDSGETSAEKEDLPEHSTKPIEDTLLQIRRRIRERRELTGKRPLEIAEDQYRRRSAQIIEALQKDFPDGTEPTPLHLVLAARYIEAEIDFEEYCNAVLRI